MKIKTAEFIKSSPNLELCPDTGLPEYAFIGRSNVGKSSLINMITGNSRLAKISSTPGKTQTINHFLINESWYMVDLPGYGYAKVSKILRSTWDTMIKQYVYHCNTLVCLFVLLDARHPPQKNDIVFMEDLGKHEVPFVMTFTKIDKLSSSALNKNLLRYKREMLKQWSELPPLFATSAVSNHGRDEILNFIAKNNSLISKKNMDIQN